MSYRHNIRQGGIKKYLANKKNGKDYIEVNGQRCKYDMQNGKWKLIKIEDLLNTKYGGETFVTYNK